MSSVNTDVLRRLNHLYNICKAGERGFEVVAANVANRGLKVLLRTYAQERAQFAGELKEEIQRLGGHISEGALLLWLGPIHRGRMDIFAALTIGAQNVENVVLGEALLGENAAVSAYRRDQAAVLPAETRALLERQYQQIKATRDQVALLRGQTGKRLVVRLFDSDGNAQAAMQALKHAGFSPDNMEVIDVKQVSRVYEGHGNRVSETIISGAVGGALWGSLIGAVAGVSVASVPDMQPVAGNALQSWAVIALGGTVLGAIGAAFLGFIIGNGISEEDVYLYDDSVRHGVNLVRLYTNNERAAEAAQIMYQINAAARAHAGEEPAQAPSGQ